jgi:hypothetical protein
MTRSILFSFALFLMTFNTKGQNMVIVDGDELHLRDSLEGEITLLSSIKRGKQNQDALWITYDRRPGVDPWIENRENPDQNFIKYWGEKGLKIFGILTTYDNCLCFKTKAMSSPDMFLLHFKIRGDDWAKMQELYPGMVPYIRKIN